MQNGWIQDGRIQNDRIQEGYHHQVNQIEWEWVRVRVEWECFWVNLREDNKVSESKMAVSESNMAEFKMTAIMKLNLREDNKVSESKMAVSESKMAELKIAAIIKLSQNEWVKFFCANTGEGTVSEFFFCAIGGKQSWQVWVSLRGKTKMAESKMAQSKMDAIIRMSENVLVKFYVQNSWIQYGRIQNDRIQEGCHHQVNQIEWDYVRFRVEWECFEWIWEKITRCLNPRWQCLNPRWKSSRWLPSSSWVRMNEWSFFVQILGRELWVNVFLCNWW